MNILKKIVLLGTMGVMSATLFTGCGVDVEGEWKLSKIKMDGETYTAKEFEEEYGTELDFSLEFTEDEIIANAFGEEDSVDYEIDGDEIVVDDEDDMDVTYDGDDDTITMEGDGMTMIFKRK